MLMRLILKLLGLGKPAPTVEIKTSISAARANGQGIAVEKPTGHHRDAIVYLVNHSNEIKPEARERVIAHIMRDTDLFTDGTLLTLDEKKQLGLNTRQKIHKVLTEVLAEPGLMGGGPAQVIPNISLAAHHSASNFGHLQRYEKSGVCDKVKYLGCDLGGEAPCKWGKSKQGKGVPIDAELEKERLHACDTEPYCKGYFEPIIKDL
jgi:hypothetical protein